VSIKPFLSQAKRRDASHSQKIHHNSKEKAGTWPRKIVRILPSAQTDADITFQKNGHYFKGWFLVGAARSGQDTDST
jgi:hypothetical protein